VIVIDGARFALGCGSRDTESMRVTRPSRHRWRAMMAAAEIGGALLGARAGKVWWRRQPRAWQRSAWS
jgi:hypothetical protein